MKVVVNSCFGGFNISDEQGALLGLESHSYKDGINNEVFWTYDADKLRIDERLISSVENGDNGGRYSNLVVKEIPDGVFWQVQEYDGYESIVWSESEIHWI